MDINLATLLLNTFGFLLLIFLLNKFCFRILIEALEKKATEENLVRLRVEESEKQANLAVHQAESLLKEAREESKRLKKETQGVIAREKEQALLEARDQAKAQIHQAQLEISKQAEVVRKRLLNSVGELSLEMTSKILSREISASDRDVYVEKFSKEIDSKGGESVFVDNGGKKL